MKKQSQLDFVIPCYKNTAHHLLPIIKAHSELAHADSQRFFVIIDEDDESRYYIEKNVSSLRQDVHIIITESLIDKAAFHHSIQTKCGVDSLYYPWYWQQFKKLFSFLIPEIREQIILWDCDTYPLKKCDFFVSEVPMVMTSKAEYHVPYFLTFYNLTGFLCLPPFSSITQHAAVSKTELAELAQLFQTGAISKDSILGKGYFDQKRYFDRVFSSLSLAKDLNQLFGDYEYFTLLRFYKKTPFLFVSYPHFRYGGLLPLPRFFILRILALFGFYNVSFERYHMFEGLRLSNALSRLF